PLDDLRLVLAPAEDDAANLAPSVAARRGDDPLAVLSPVESLDLPEVALDARLLHLVDGFDHEARPQLSVVGMLVVADMVELGRRSRYQQLEHVQPAAGVQIFTQLAQARRLARIERRVAPGVV